MTSPKVTELPRTLEPITRDSFIDGSADVAPLTAPATACEAGAPNDAAPPNIAHPDRLTSPITPHSSRRGRMHSSHHPARRALLSALAAATAIGAVAAGPAAALSAVPADAARKPIDPRSALSASAEVRATLAAQAPLVAAADRIRRLDEPRDADERGGLAGIRVDDRHHAVHVWWKGPIPRSLQAERARSDVKIDVRPARFSERELLGAARSLARRVKPRDGVARIGPVTDGSGLEMAVARRRAMPLAAAARRHVPVRVVRATAARAATRTADFPPYWAGATVRPLGGSNTCTSGFAIARYFLWFETMRGILTAGHCATTSTTFLDGRNFTIGTAEAGADAQSAPHSDALVIPTRSGALTYTGGIGSSTSLGVGGSTGSFVGQSVCTSGAATGQHCGARVTAINQLVFLLPSFRPVEGVALADGLGGPTSGPGDSGGPVFVPMPGDPMRVLGSGMIVGAFGGAVTCPDGTAGCTTGVAYVDLGYVLTAKGVSLLTF
jgi:hypothetical protein